MDDSGQEHKTDILKNPNSNTPAMALSRAPAGGVPFLVLVVLIGLCALAAGCIRDAGGAEQATPSPVSITTPVPGTTEAGLSPNLHNQTGVNITLDSVIRSDRIHGARLNDINVFIIVNLTIANQGTGDYELLPSRILLNGDPPDTQTTLLLDTPVSWGTVPPGEALRGEVVFRVQEVTQKLVLNITGTKGELLLTKELNEGPLIGYATAKSETLRALMQNTDFDDVISRLDTPLLAAKYTNERFTYFNEPYSWHYRPEKFFVTRKGDCCEFSWFFAYALAAHGYDGRMVAFKYYNKDGAQDMHVVAVFTERDGQLRYATIPDLTKFHNASSVDDVLAQEKERLEFRDLISYRIQDPVSADSCFYR